MQFPVPSISEDVGKDMEGGGSETETLKTWAGLKELNYYIRAQIEFRTLDFELLHIFFLF